MSTQARTIPSVKLIGSVTDMEEILEYHSVHDLRWIDENTLEFKAVYPILGNMNTCVRATLDDLSPTSRDILMRAVGGEFGDIEPPPAVIKTWESVLLFKEEFTQEERIAMRQFARNDLVAEDFLDLLNGATFVSADDPRLAAGLQYMVSSGVLTAERVDEILGTL